MRPARIRRKTRPLPGIEQCDTGPAAPEPLGQLSRLMEMQTAQYLEAKHQKKELDLLAQVLASAVVD